MRGMTREIQAAGYENHLVNLCGRNAQQGKNFQ